MYVLRYLRQAARHTTTIVSIAAIAAASALPILTCADTAPPSGTPATVSADALPTTQVDGIVWKQAIYGNKVYATGRFTAARPAGVAVGGSGSVTRTNILAYDITTGQLDTSFVHSLTGGTTPQGRSIAVSPDGTRLYVGGDFTTVDGQAHSNFVAFDLTNNTVLPGFSGANGEVLAVAATNTQAYIGGWFSQAAGQNRSLVAAYNTDGTLNTSWTANVNGLSGSHVAGLVTVPSTGNLIIGGSFNSINGQTYYSNGAVKLTTGVDVTPWASQSSTFPIRLQPPTGASGSGLGITSMSTDGTQVYFSSFTSLDVAPHPGSFEGTAAINPSNGNVIFINDCAGDTYDVFPVGQVLYSVSHAHNCSPMDGYPQWPNHWQRALAETTYPTSTDGPGMGGNYPSYEGQPRGDILNWFPDLSIGNVSGSSQAAWSVVGNSQYVALGGEFPSVNGTAQQGLVRFTVAANAPNKVGPDAYTGAGYGIYSYGANASGDSFVRVYNTGDKDNGNLTYKVYRKGTTQLVGTGTLDSRFWKTDNFTLTDHNLPQGVSAQYQVVVTDPFGNSRTISDAAVVNDTDGRITYNGTWINSQNRAGDHPDFATGIHYTNTDGDSYSYDFYGSAIQLIAEKTAGSGTMDISVDGGAAVQANAYSDTTLFQQTIYSTSGLGFGHHTITVTKTGGSYMELDAIHVTQDNIYDDTDSSVTYATPANWTSRQNTTYGDFGNGIHYTTVNGESATFTFTGTSVALMSEKNSTRGNISVSIDGGTPVTASEYNASGTLFQQIVFSKTGLSSGTHTIKVTKSSGSYMDVDAVFSR